MTHDEQRRQWGRLVWERPEPLAAGSYQSVSLRYVAGSMGLDEHGGIRLSFRDTTDFGGFQFHDPAGDNYVAAYTREGLRLHLEFSRKGNIRPYRKALYIHVLDGSLNEGEEIRLVFGDRSQGSRGWRLQTCVEQDFHALVESDPLGTHDYVVLPDRLAFDIVPGPGYRYRLNVPTRVQAGEPVRLRVKCEDLWGNPLRSLDARPAVTCAGVDDGTAGEPLAVAPTHEDGVLTYALEAPAAPGLYHYAIADGEVRGDTSNPMVVLPPGGDAGLRYYWGDYHGQTGETVGTGSVEDYFHFGRHFGFLDGSCHQGNDFQIDGPTWARIVKAGNDSYEPGAFVTFNGIEWSGTTPMGGDHNVLFNEDHPPLYRSSGWLAPDGERMEEVAPLSKLYETLKQHDAMTIPHIGGRPAALETTDPDVERLVELHSAWGTFEWVYQRAFAKGFKVGFVCNSDGHKGRPGASYPGASTFGTLGGLTCVLAPTATRDDFWAALRERRCYGTTGQRIYVDVSAEGRPMGADLDVQGPFTIAGQVVGTAPLFGVDLMREAEVLETIRPSVWAESDGAEDWLIVRVGGSRVYGRERKVTWQGGLAVDGNRIAEARMHGLFNPLRGIRAERPDGLEFDFISTGNSINLCLRLEGGREGRLHFRSGPTTFDLPLAEIGHTPRRMYEAYVDQFAEVFTAPLPQLPRRVEFRFQAPPPAKSATPYFIRVRQADEGKAWTSPFYVTMV